MTNFDLLDRYFSNELDKGEMKAFNERLKNDPEFNQEFQEIKEIKLAVKVEARKNIKSFLTDIEDSQYPQKLTTNNQTAMKRILTVAASLTLMVSVSYFVLNGSGQPTPQDVFTEYYKPYNNLNGQVRGGTIDTESLSVAAYSAYDAGNYALAVENFSALIEVEKSAENYFYMSIANMEIGDYDAAIKDLNTTLNDFSTFKDQSKWYLSLALISTNNQEEALSSLASLVISENSFSARSANVLAKLGYELDLENEEGGIAAVIVVKPEEIDSPDGSTAYDRKVQYGEIIDPMTNRVYKFHSEFPLLGLQSGDMVEYMIIKEAKGKKAKGFAFLLEKTN